MSKLRVGIGVAILWFLAAVSGELMAGAGQPGISYRLLWHGYRLGQLSPDTSSRLRITSEDNTDPATFKFSPADKDGRPILTCDSDGICSLRWSADFYRSGREIFHDQPQGSLKLGVGWSWTSDAISFGEPLIVHLVRHGRVYGETLYHGVAFWGEMTPRLPR